MRNREIPKGLRDFLPDEVKIRRKMEKKALDLFRSYGYKEVRTPTFEYLEVIEAGTCRDMREELFLFIDREGRIVSLRQEMTVGIARMAATICAKRFFHSACAILPMSSGTSNRKRHSTGSSGRWALNCWALPDPGPMPK